MTVGQLCACLRGFDDDMEVTALWDTIPSWEIHSVHEYQGRVVLDVGTVDGDWWIIEKDLQEAKERK